MFELNPKYVLCGVLLVETEACEIYCDVETGTLVYMDSMDGSTMCIGEMSVSDPLELDGVAGYKRELLNGHFAGAIGLVFTRGGIVYAITDEYTAEVRTYAGLKSHSDNTVSIDINQDFTDDED